MEDEVERHKVCKTSRSWSIFNYWLIATDATQMLSSTIKWQFLEGRVFRTSDKCEYGLLLLLFLIQLKVRLFLWVGDFFFLMKFGFDRPPFHAVTSHHDFMYQISFNFLPYSFLMFSNSFFQMHYIKKKKSFLIDFKYLFKVWASQVCQKNWVILTLELIYFIYLFVKGIEWINFQEIVVSFEVWG